MKKDHFQWENPLSMTMFNSKVLVITRGYFCRVSIDDEESQSVNRLLRCTASSFAPGQSLQAAGLDILPEKAQKGQWGHMELSHNSRKLVADQEGWLNFKNCYEDVSVFVRRLGILQKSMNSAATREWDPAEQRR